MGCGSLVRAIQLHGGTVEVTRKLGFEPQRGNLSTLLALWAQISALQAVAGIPAADMPTKAELRQHGAPQAEGLGPTSAKTSNPEYPELPDARHSHQGGA